MIIGRNPIEANANTGEIQLLGNPVAYMGYGNRGCGVFKGGVQN